MQIGSLGDNLHEMSKPIFQEKNLKSIVNLSSVVTVKEHFDQQLHCLLRHVCRNI